MNALVVPCAIAAAFVLAVAFVDAAVAAAVIAGLVFSRVPAVLLHSESISPAVLAVVLGVAASARWRREDGRRNRRALAFGLAGVSSLAVLAMSYLWASDVHAAANTVTADLSACAALGRLNSKSQRAIHDRLVCFITHPITVVIFDCNQRGNDLPALLIDR